MTTGTLVEAFEGLALGLGEAYLKATVVMVVALVLHRVLAGRSAAMRHALWVACFTGLGLTAVAVGGLPRLDLAWLPAGPTEVVTSAATGVTAATAATAATAVTGATVATTPEVTAVGAGPDEARLRPVPAGGHPSVPWLPAGAALVWTIGFGLLAVRVPLDAWRYHRMVRAAGAAPSSWAGPLERVLAGAPPGSSARVLVGDVAVPAVFGVRRPVILFPATAVDWTLERIEMVLRHELAHVTRRDTVATALVDVVAAVFWLHPLTSVLLRRFRIDRERACDELVLLAGVRPTSYAAELVAVARTVAGSVTPRVGARPGVVLAADSELHHRIDGILGFRGGGTPPGTGVLALSVVLLFGVVLPFGAARLTERPRAPMVEPELPTLAELLGRLEDGSPTERRRAAWALGDREDPGAVPGLVALLTDGDPEIRGLSAWSLGEIKDRRALNVLLDAVGSEPDAVAREMIVRTVGELSAVRSVPTLAATLSDSNPAVRAAAAWSLGEVGSPGALDALRGALRDPDPGVRRTATEALADRAGDGADRLLVRALRDEDAAVRELAASKLGRLGAFGSVEALTDALTDDHPAVRRAATRSLGLIGDSRAVDALIDRLRDPDLDVRSWAVWSLDELDPTVDADHPKQGFDQETLPGVAN